MYDCVTSRVILLSVQNDLSNKVLKHYVALYYIAAK